MVDRIVALLNQAVVAGNNYSQLQVTPLNEPISAGATVVVGAGGNPTWSVVLSQQGNAGDQVLNIVPSSPSAGFGKSTPLGEQYTQYTYETALFPGDDQINIPVGVSTGSKVTRPAAFELFLPGVLVAFNNISVLWGTIIPLARVKEIWFVVTTAINWTGAGQCTLAAYTSRIAQAASQAAATQLSAMPVSGTTGRVRLGAAQNIGGASVSTLALNSAFRIGPGDIAELGNWQNFVGVELLLPAGATGISGAATASIVHGGG